MATISDFFTIKSLVADGLGVSFLYAPAVSGELERGELVRFDLAELPMSGAFSFVCLKDNLFAADWIAWINDIAPLEQGLHPLRAEHTGSARMLALLSEYRIL